jgi:hypothetical protein
MNSSHQRLSSTDDDLSTENLNGFSRNHRIRSSLPFIIKPAVKSNSLGKKFQSKIKKPRRSAFRSLLFNLW